MQDKEIHLAYIAVDEDIPNKGRQCPWCRNSEILKTLTTRTILYPNLLRMSIQHSEKDASRMMPISPQKHPGSKAVTDDVSKYQDLTCSLPYPSNIYVKPACKMNQIKAVIFYLLFGHIKGNN